MPQPGREKRVVKKRANGKLPSSFFASRSALGKSDLFHDLRFDRENN